MTPMSINFVQAVDIDYDIMTPLENYLISSGALGFTPKLTATINNSTTHHKLFIQDTEQTLQVGIAARNSIGHSPYMYAELAPGT